MRATWGPHKVLFLFLTSSQKLVFFLQFSASSKQSSLVTWIKTHLIVVHQETLNFINRLGTTFFIAWHQSPLYCWSDAVCTCWFKLSISITSSINLPSVICICKINYNLQAWKLQPGKPMIHFLSWDSYFSDTKNTPLLETNCTWCLQRKKTSSCINSLIIMWISVQQWIRYFWAHKWSFKESNKPFCCNQNNSLQNWETVLNILNYIELNWKHSNNSLTIWTKGGSSCYPALCDERICLLAVCVGACQLSVYLMAGHYPAWEENEASEGGE